MCCVITDITQGISIFIFCEVNKENINSVRNERAINNIKTEKRDHFEEKRTK